MPNQKFFTNDTHDLDLNLDQLTGNQAWEVPDDSGTVALQQWVVDLFNTGAKKDNVALATTGNITLGGLQTIDGVTLVDGERVLVKDQSAGAENGIYIAGPAAWVRADDFDTDEDAEGGASLFIDSGTVNGGTGWRLTTPADPVVGTDTLVFGQFSGGTAAVQSVFGRIGAVTQVSGDYTAAQVTNVPAGSLVATNSQAAINELDTRKADSAELASTANGDGASLIGVEDAAGNFTATTAEGIFNEIAGQLQTSTAAAEGLIELATSAEVAADDATRAVTGATLGANYTKTSALAAVTTGNGAALIGLEDSGSFYTGMTVEAGMAEIGQDLADLRSLTGTADGEDDLGTFTGTTIADGVSIKAGLQALETAIEASSLNGTAQTYSTSNVSTLRTMDANAITLQGLSDFVATMAEDLRTRGIFA